MGEDICPAVQNCTQKRMGPVEIEFVHETQITERYRLNIPEDVHRFLTDCSSEDTLEYIWNHDTRNDTLLLSCEKSRIEEVNKLGASDDYQSGGRTQLPDGVKHEFEFEIGDHLYLWTHNLMDTAGAPSVFVWEPEQVESLFLEPVATMPEDQLFPNF